MGTLGNFVLGFLPMTISRVVILFLKGADGVQKVLPKDLNSFGEYMLVFTTLLRLLHWTADVVVKKQCG